MVNVAENTLKEVDVILWLVEADHLHRGRRASHCRAAFEDQDAGHSGY